MLQQNCFEASSLVLSIGYYFIVVVGGGVGAGGVAVVVVFVFVSDIDNDGDVIDEIDYKVFMYC